MIEFAFNDLDSFLSMGKYGSYVWLCYGLTFGVILVNVMLYRFRQKRILDDIRMDQLRDKKKQANVQ